MGKKKKYDYDAVKPLEPRECGEDIKNVWFLLAIILLIVLTASIIVTVYKYI